MNFLTIFLEKLGVIGVTLITSIIQGLCLYFGIHNAAIFGPIWTLVGMYAYTEYCGTWMIEKITKFMQKIVKAFEKAVVKSATIVSKQLQETGTNLTKGISISSLMEGFSKHKIGVGLCAKTVMEAKSGTQIMEETCKIASMLGLEHHIVTAAIGKLSSLSGETIQGMVAEQEQIVSEHGLEDIEKFIPLISSVAAFADLEITELHVGSKMDKIARNIKSAEVITSQIRQVCEKAGIIKPVNFSIIEELNVMVNSLKEDYLWIAGLLAIKGSDFMKPQNYTRVEKFKKDVKAASIKMRSIDIPQIRNNQIVTECNFIIMKSLDFINQVEVIRSNMGFRPVPVGICIKGPSQFGKSTMIPVLCELVKQKLKPYRSIFGDTDHWTRWDANQREEFDSGYCGQEIVYMDDAFQDKTNKDHLMWYTYISPTCVGTLQGVAENKGLPFRAMMCITTCNAYPRTSIAVNHIQALHERFPITVEVSMPKGKKKPKDFDPTFKYLDMKVSTMKNFVEGSEMSEDTSLDDLADRIVTNLIDQQTLFLAKMQALQTLPTEEHSGEEDFEEFLKQLDNVEDEGESSKDLGIIEEELPSLRMDPVKQRGTFNDQIDFEQLARVTIENLIIATTMETPHTVFHLGDWTRFLERKIKGGTECWSSDLYQGDDALFSAIISLGAWHVPEEDYKEFYNEYIKQPLLLVENQLGDLYVWGPQLEGGKTLYLLSPTTISVIREQLEPFWKKKGKKWARKLCNFFTDRSLLRVYFRQYIQIQAFSLLGPLAFLQSARIYATISSEYGRIPYFHRLNGRSDFHPYNLGLGVISIAAMPITFLSRGFEYLDQITERLRRGMYGILVKCLEYLGLDTSHIWREIADLTSFVINDTLTIALASILVYLLYRLIRLLFSKPKVEEHSKNEIGKHSRKEKNVRNKERKIVRVRKLNLHSKELECETSCNRENILIEVDEKEWIKFGPCNAKDTLYDIEFLEYILSQNQDNSCLKTSIVNMKNTHCSMYFEDDDDFTLEKSKFVGAYKQQFVIDDIEVPIFEITMELVGSTNEVLDQYIRFISKFKEKKVCDWKAEIYSRLIMENCYLKIKIVCLNTNIQGKPGRFTNKMLKDLKLISEDLKGVKTRSEQTCAQIIELRGRDEAIELVQQIVKNHQVFMSYVDKSLLDSDSRGRSTHGLGHRDLIVFNAHNYEKGDLVRFWRYHEKTSKNYHLCIVDKIDKVRDFGIARIVSKRYAQEMLLRQGFVNSCVNMNTVKEEFRSIESHLCDNKVWYDLCNEQTCLNFLPTSGGMTKGRATIVKPRLYDLKNGREERDWFQVNDLNINLELARPGDCGGVIVSCNDRFQTKVIGFHSGGTNSYWLATIFRKEDLNLVEEHGDDDSWMRMIVNGAPTDLPVGPEVTFIGKFIGTTKPSNEKNSSKWTYAPWADVFEEQLQPSPLDAYDIRIEEEVMENDQGMKSLLLKPNSIMCSLLPEMDNEILDRIKNQIVEEMTLKIGHITKTSEDLDQCIHEGMNGHRDNEFVKNLEINKASGVPWNEIPNCAKKCDFLDNTEGLITFKLDDKGKALKKRIEYKLKEAKESKRILSFSNSKLKDELIKIASVKKGKTRVFHCIPVDKVISDASMFGHFKEAYCRNFINLNHAVGVNPHSIGWRMIFDHLNKHPNVFDMDFSNYDKRLQAILMETTFQIIREVIQNKCPDAWDNARKILQEEAIETYVIDYDTVYKTKRGNKSGEYLTTIINCIANDILSFYTWIKVTGIDDLETFRSNVSLITFGDDKCESVSDEFADKYNYFTSKDVMSSIGHEITPGNKDGIESKFCGIDKLQFLKRTFVEESGIILAPLSTRSIESPFVWTQILTSEVTIWKNLIEQSLYEASLHGEDYYNYFKNNLKKGSDSTLLSSVSSVLCCSFEQIRSKYLRVWFNKKTHLDDD